MLLDEYVGELMLNGVEITELYMGDTLLWSKE